MSNFHFLFSSRFLLSAGFSASFGISHKRLNFATPGIRFSSHSFCTRLSEMPHFFAASGAEIYSNISFTNACAYGIHFSIYFFARNIFLQTYSRHSCKNGFSPDKFRLFFFCQALKYTLIPFFQQWSAFCDKIQLHVKPFLP